MPDTPPEAAAAPRRAARPGRRRAFRALAAFLGLLVGVLLLEGIGAVGLSIVKGRYEAVPPDEVRATCLLDDRTPPGDVVPWVGYAVAPNVRTPSAETNAYGLRNGPIDERPADGTLRVLIVGGSVAWGYAARSNAETIAAYLEAALSARAGDLGYARVEVLNAGVPGYVSWQGALAYATRLFTLAPRVVIAIDGTNDVESAIRNGRAGFSLRVPERVPPRPSLWDALSPWVRYRFERLRSVRLYRELRPRTVAGHRPPEPRAVAAEYARAMATLARAARGAGAPEPPAEVVCVLQPTLFERKLPAPFEEAALAEQEHRLPGIGDYHRACYAALREALARLEREEPHVAALDATGIFEGEPAIRYVDHCHLVPAGRERLAGAIADVVARRLSPGAAHRAEGAGGE